MSIGIALADAANNCQRDNAEATLTLKSGVQVTGRLTRSTLMTTAHVEHDDGGWTTLLVEEIAAVNSHRKAQW